MKDFVEKDGTPPNKKNKNNKKRKRKKTKITKEKKKIERDIEIKCEQWEKEMGYPMKFDWNNGVWYELKCNKEGEWMNLMSYSMKLLITKPKWSYLSPQPRYEPWKTFEILIDFTIVLIGK